MGNKTATKELSASIENGNADRLLYILKKYPELINKELDTNTRHTPLIRAILAENYTISRILLVDFQAKVNTIHGNICALSAAVIKNNLDLLKLLIQFGANPKIQIRNNLTVMDFAILYGAYDVAYYLSRKYSMRISLDVNKFHNLRKQQNLPNTTNYQSFLTMLSQQAHPSDFYKLFPPKTILLKQNNQNVSHSSRINQNPLYLKKQFNVQYLCSTDDRTQVRYTKQCV